MSEQERNAGQALLDALAYCDDNRIESMKDVEKHDAEGKTVPPHYRAKHSLDVIQALVAGNNSEEGPSDEAVQNAKDELERLKGE